MKRTLTIAILMLIAATPTTRHPATAAWGATDKAQGKPNILFIFTDDQAAWTVGRGSDPQFQTPNMDRLAREGAQLANAFVVTPVCSPSRATLLTGRYGTEVGITEWIHLYKEPALGLDPAVTTWPKVLQAAGYTTGLVGKWHLGRLRRFHPRHYGYDDYMGTITARDSNINPILEKDGKRQPMKGLMPDILTDHAIGFIRENKDRPFALSMHFRVPHKGSWRVPQAESLPFENRPVRVPDPEYANLDAKRAVTELRRYMTVVHILDRNVGRLLDTLDELDLTDRTIVVLTSDHGFNIGHHGLSGKGNADWMLTRQPRPDLWPDKERPNLFDTSLRVPCIVRWPGVIKPATVIEETVTNLDWFPTLLGMASVEPPAGWTHSGRNFLPLLTGHPIEGWDNDLYCEYSIHADPLHDHMRMWRTPKWKLVRHFTRPRRDELYDLASDPGETTNLIDDSRPEVRQIINRLHQRIIERMRELDDPVIEVLEQENPGRLKVVVGPSMGRML